jgi:hypothetical protein
MRGKVFCRGAVFYPKLECLDHLIIVPCESTGARRSSSAAPYIPALKDGVLRRN